MVKNCGTLKPRCSNKTCSFNLHLSTGYLWWVWCYMWQVQYDQKSPAVWPVSHPIAQVAKLQRYMVSRYKKINGTCILPKIKILSMQQPRYLPYLEPCMAQFFIFPHLLPPLVFECKSNVFVMFITWHRWIVHEPYLRQATWLVSATTCD